MTPDATTWTLVVLMLAVSGYHLVRLVTPRRTRTVAVDLAHLAMGVAMAGMLAGRLPPSDARLLALGFAVPTAWFVGRAVHGYVMVGAHADPGPLGQAVGGAAMVYMLAAAAAERPMAGMTMPAGPPVLTWLLVTALAGACVPQLSRPSVGAGCQVAMSATAAYMLLAV